MGRAPLEGCWAPPVDDGKEYIPTERCNLSQSLGVLGPVHRSSENRVNAAFAKAVVGKIQFD